MMLSTIGSYLRDNLLVLSSSALCATVLCATTSCATTPTSSLDNSATHAPRITDIPKIAGVKVDAGGAVTDWKGQGLVIRALAGENAVLRKSADFQVTGRLGWNDEGVLLQVDVTDSSPCEEPNASRMFMGDSVEFFLMTTDKTAGFPQIIASPGRGTPTASDRGNEQRKEDRIAAVSAPRIKVFDYRNIAFKKDAPAFTPRVAAKKTDHGYIMDLVIPWTSMKVKPEPGSIVGVRFGVNDWDGPVQQRGGWLNYQAGPGWWGDFPLVRLSDKLSAPKPIAVWGGAEDIKFAYVSAFAEPQLAGKTLTVLDGTKVLGSAPLILDGNHASAQVRLPIPGPAAQGAAPAPALPAILTAKVEGEALQTITLPDLVKARKDMFLSGANQGRGEGRPDPATAWLKPRGKDVFSETEFPAFDYPEPDRIRQTFGAYTIDTEYYAGYSAISETRSTTLPQFTRITKPTTPGRYGAITTVFLNGTTDTYTIYRTLYCLPKDAAPGTQPARTQIAKAENPSATADEVDKADRDWWHALRKQLGTAVRYEYFVRLPKGYDEDPSKRWPVIFYLHGSGRGEEPQRARVDGPQTNATTKADFPFIVVSLRSPGGWLPNAVEEVVDEVAATARTDPTRYYLCGFSMGAMGTWSVTEDRPERFAAVAGVGGRTGDLKRIPNIKHPPAWVINGGDDTTCTSADAQKRVDALKAAGVEVKWTEIPNAGHVDSDDLAYKWDELYTWFLQHHR